MIETIATVATLPVSGLCDNCLSGLRHRFVQHTAVRIGATSNYPGSTSPHGSRPRLGLTTAVQIICRLILTEAAARTWATWITRAAGHHSSGRLEISIHNVLTGRGAVYVGLFDHWGSFPRAGKHIRGAVVEATGSKVDAVFYDVPYGRYAVAAFQDLNGNGILDFALGMPIEPFGFSDGTTAGVESPPTFADSAFRLSTPTSSVAITLHPGAAMQARTCASRSRLPTFLMGAAKVVGGFDWPAGDSPVRRLEALPASVAELARAVHADIKRSVAATIPSSGLLDRAVQAVVEGTFR